MIIYQMIGTNRFFNQVTVGSRKGEVLIALREGSSLNCIMVTLEELNEQFVEICRF